MATSLRSRLAVVFIMAGALALTPVPSSASSSPTIQVLVPNTVQSGVSTLLMAEVTQNASLGSPSGTVTFGTGYGTTLGTAPLVATTPGTARAVLSWTPPPEFTVPLIARYTPTGASSVAATSAYQRPLITSAPVPVAIRLTPTPNAGPIQIDAVLGNGFGVGSVSFFVDGRGWTGSVPTVNGVASVTWNATPGVQAILVQYSSTASNPAGFAVQTGTSTQVVNVLP
ncbi:MAG TPA: hypothetical protein DCQ36_01600 [Actinobacteria bacterium]|nr:hypothetical protein [Actinomycetota bacterium]